MDISDHMPCKVQDEITYSFPNFNGLTEFWESNVYFGPAALNIIRIHFREKEADK